MAELAAGSPTLEDVEVVLVPAGGEPRLLTPISETMRWTTAAVGGFGSFSASFPGRRLWEERRRIEGAMLRVQLGQKVLWEGQLEDPEYTLADASEATSFTGFGLRRRLQEASVRRVWVDRNVVSRFVARPFNPPIWNLSMGQLDETDSQKQGLQLQGDNATPQVYGPNVTGPWFWFPFPPASSFIRPTALIMTVLRSKVTGGNHLPSAILEYDGFADEFTDFTLGAANVGEVKTVIFDQTRRLARLRLGLRIGGSSFTPDGTDFVQFYDMRFLHAMTVEDDPNDGGFFGGTLLRDLITFVPDLKPGVIEEGDEFLIQQIGNHARTSVLAIAEEVAAYYPHELAVWEDGRVDWTSPRPEPDWVLTVADHEELNLRESLDGAARTTYLQFSDVLFDSITNEEAVESTDPRSPYVRQARTKDEIVSAGFPMTSTSAHALARKLNGISGGAPPTTGRAVLRTDRVVAHAQLGKMPAWSIRAGENILIADLPVTQPLEGGLDGETLFHIVSADVNHEEGTVTLELDGQTRRADVLMARLAAATRVVTG